MRLKLIDQRYLSSSTVFRAGGFAWTALVDSASSFKVLKVLHNTDPKAISLFDQEADVLQKLHHSGIPKIENGGRFNYTPDVS